jgi:hypothetical protein
MMKVDWSDLLGRAEELDRPLSDEELSLWKRGILDGNSRMWNVQYVHAVQRAIEGHDRGELDAMLRAEIPIPAFLLPFIASEPQGRRPAAFTLLQDRINLRIFEHAVQFLQMSEAEAKRWLAEKRGVNKKTVERSLKRAEERD